MVGGPVRHRMNMPSGYPVRVANLAGVVLARGVTGSRGTFQFVLAAPATYVLTAGEPPTRRSDGSQAGGARCQPQRVRVRAHQHLHVKLYCAIK